MPEVVIMAVAVDLSYTWAGMTPNATYALVGRWCGVGGLYRTSKAGRLEEGMCVAYPETLPQYPTPVLNKACLLAIYGRSSLQYEIKTTRLVRPLPLAHREVVSASTGIATR